MAVNDSRQDKSGVKGLVPRGEEGRGLAKTDGLIPPTEKAQRPDGRFPGDGRGSSFGSPTLGRVLEQAGLISSPMLKEIQDTIQQEAGMTLRKAVVSTGLVREDEILDALAQEMGMEKVALHEVKVTPELLSAIDPKIARTYHVFPVRVTEDTVYVALADPLNIEVTDDLEKVLGKKVVGLVAPEDEIIHAIRRYYEADEVNTLYEDFTHEVTKEEGKDSYSNVMLDDQTEINAAPVVRFVDLVFKQAIHDRASDIHIEPAKNSLVVRFRVDGVLQEIPSPPKKWQKAIISRVKVLSGMDLAEKRLPQDGRIKLNIQGGKKMIDVRVSALPAIYGESMVMRLLDQSTVLLGLEEVGFLPDNIRLFEQLIRAPNGVILMTGPTGSGKTTTLYSALSVLNTPDRKIITIENPVEYMIEGINQIQVDEAIELTFAACLRSALRQAPEIIMVGEIRDFETAEIGIRAALTGHLVFSTLHTNDAPSAATRLTDIGVKPFLISSSVQAVIAQRLLRVICRHCAETYHAKAEEIREMGYEPEKYRDYQFHRGRGCDRCNFSGYRGRTAIHEIFVPDSTAKQMVIRSESASRLKRYAVSRGMRTLRMDGWEKILLGQVTTTEVIRITQTDVL
jgi:type II secretory ATPase GspE/PulE/Tfp pilus assembly ATPase PilB-like protein